MNVHATRDLDASRPSHPLATAKPREPRRGRRWLAAGAAGAAAAALANHLLARRSEARHPPGGRFLEVGGVRLHYRERGEGPVIVLLHGNGVSGEDFAVSGLLDDLAGGHRVIAFDRPGFGYSTRPRRRAWTAKVQARLLLEALGALGVRRPVIVGHSWGSLVAANMALEAPDEIAGVALLSGYFRPTARLDAAMAAGPAVPLLGDLMRFTVSPALGRLMTPMILKHTFAPAPVSARFARDYPIELSLRPSQLRAAAAEAGMMVPEAAALAKRLPGLATPALILTGREDRVVNASHQSGWLAEQLPQARLVSVEGAGHMVHHTAPERVAAEILAFALSMEP